MYSHSLGSLCWIKEWVLQPLSYMMPKYQYLIFTKAVNKISRKFLQYLEYLAEEVLSKSLLGIFWTFVKFRCYVIELYQTFELAPDVNVPTRNQPEGIVARLRIDHQLVSKRYWPWARASNRENTRAVGFCFFIILCAGISITRLPADGMKYVITTSNFRMFIT